MDKKNILIGAGFATLFALDGLILFGLVQTYDELMDEKFNSRLRKIDLTSEIDRAKFDLENKIDDMDIEMTKMKYDVKWVVDTINDFLDGHKEEETK